MILNVTKDYIFFYTLIIQAKVRGSIQNSLGMSSHSELISSQESSG
jgi:hypothetical protein